VSGPRQVLILNDEADELLLLRQALIRDFPGIAVLEYTDAEAALAKLRTQEVDAVITDNRMPAMTGLEFVARFRAENALTVVIMLTGSAEKEAEAIDAGVTTFVAGASWVEIRQQLRRALEKTGA